MHTAKHARDLWFLRPSLTQGGWRGEGEGISARCLILTSVARCTSCYISHIYIYTCRQFATTPGGVFSFSNPILFGESSNPIRDEVPSRNCRKRETLILSESLLFGARKRERESRIRTFPLARGMNPGIRKRAISAAMSSEATRSDAKRGASRIAAGDKKLPKEDYPSGAGHRAPCPRRETLETRPVSSPPLPLPPSRDPLQLIGTFIYRDTEIGI